jgi:GT2 family glycosyltransferase
MADNAEFATIVIVSLNGEPVLPACLESIDRLDWPRDRLEVILVNNGSTDGTAAIADAWRHRRVTPVHLPANRGFAGGNNAGIALARGDWVILLNDDTEVDPGWLGRLIEEGRAHPGAGVLGSLLLYGDGRTVQHAGGRVLPNALTAHIGAQEEDRGQFGETRPCDYVTGAAFAIRRAALDAVGLLDEGYWPIYFEEIDYCRRVRTAGFEVLATPARAIHHESRTTVALSPGFLRKYHRNRLRFAAINFTFREKLRWLAHEWRWLADNRRHLPWAILLEAYARVLPCVPWWWITGMRRRRNPRIGNPPSCW